MDAFHGSYTADLRPTVSNTLSASYALSSSISSLSSSMSRARKPSAHVTKAYRQASTLFLTRRLPEALSTLLPLVAPPTCTTRKAGDVSAEPAPVAKASRTTRIKVWSLYLTVLNAILELGPDMGKEAFGAQEWKSICSKVREGHVWEDVVRNGYHGLDGSVDSEVVINLATLLLAHARNQKLNQKRLESYLAAANAPSLDMAEGVNERPPSRTSPPPPMRHRCPGADTPRDLNARVKILELYTLHVLLRNNEWDYAREFIQSSSVLDEERREAFLQALQTLQEEHADAGQRERQERQEREDLLRREMDEGRQMQAANEVRQRRRTEEERRARREDNEVHYGVEQTPSAAGSAKGRRSRNQSGLPRRLGPPTAKKSQAVSPTTLSDRAKLLYKSMRTLLDGMPTSLQTNSARLYRTLAFIIVLLFILSRRNVRERLARILAMSWDKVRATAGMGVKVSYI